MATRQRLRGLRPLRVRILIPLLIHVLSGFDRWLLSGLSHLRLSPSPERLRQPLCQERLPPREACATWRRSGPLQPICRQYRFELLLVLADCSIEVLLFRAQAEVTGLAQLPGRTLATHVRGRFTLSGSRTLSRRVVQRLGERQRQGREGPDLWRPVAGCLPALDFVRQEGNGEPDGPPSSCRRRGLFGPHEVVGLVCDLSSSGTRDLRRSLFYLVRPQGRRLWPTYEHAPSGESFLGLPSEACETIAPLARTLDPLPLRRERLI